MSDSLASTFRLRGPPATLEARALFRVHTAALHGPPAPAPVEPDMVVAPTADGGVVVFPSSPKLVILAAERARRLAPRGAAFTF